MTQPKEQNGASLRGSATRTAILESAAKLFAEKGFAGTSLQEIAERLSLTRPAVYHYFESKEHILATLVEASSVGSAQRLHAVRAEGSPDMSTALRKAVSELVRNRASAPEHFRMVDRSEAALPTELAAAHFKARRAVLAEVMGIVSDGIERGEFRVTDVRIAALSVLGMVNWVAWWYRPWEDGPPEVTADAIAESAVAMLAQPEYRVPKKPGLNGAIERVRHDLDYLASLLPEE
jgi:AcrR family transcriptional regulator